MAKFMKLGVSFLILVSVFSISVAVFLFVTKEQEIEKRLKVEEKLQVTLVEKGDVERELDGVQNVKRNLESKLEKIEEEAKILEEKYGEQKRLREYTVTELYKTKEELGNLKESLKTELNIKMALSEKLKTTEKNYSELEIQLNNIKSAKEVLEKKLKELIMNKKEAEVELEKIIVKPREDILQDKQKADITGKILLVNKEFNFVVVNLGKKDEIGTGRILAVYRGDKLLGNIRTERIYDKMLTAAILPESKKGEIKEGDKVIVLEE